MKRNTYVPASLLCIAGACSLILEMVWTRRLANVAGGAVPAAAAGLGAYLAGLALGAVWLGRRVDRVRSPARLFGLLQAGIGIWAALSLALAHGLAPVYMFLTQRLALPPVLAPFPLAAIFLGPPAILMGGGLPTAVCWRDRLGGVEVARSAGWLRFVNCVGAAGGALLAALVLIPNWGLRNATLVGVGLAGLAAVLAISAGLADASATPTAVRVPDPQPPPPSADDISPGLPVPWTLALAFLTGTLTMLCQLAQFRALSFLTSGSLSAFATISAVYILALGLGSLIGAGLLRVTSGRSVPMLCAAAFALTGAGAGLGLPLLDMLRTNLMGTIRSADGLAILRAAFSATPAALPLGILFPLLLRTIRPRHATAGHAVGHVSAAMELGSVTGPALVALLILPALGTRLTLTAASLLAAGLALVVLWQGTPKVTGFSTARILGALLLTVIALGPQAWARKTDIYRTVIRAQMERDVGPGGRIVALDEGLEGIVTVAEAWQDREGRPLRLLYIGRKMQSEDSTPWRRIEKTMGALPALLCPVVGGSAFHIGLGSGVTAAFSQAVAPDRQVTVAELVPGVAEHMPRFHHNAPPRLTVRIGEGRSLLGVQPEPLNLVVTDIIFPESAGAGGLFSREYFALVRARLSEDGLFVQWLPLWQMSPRAFMATVRAFLDVFPDATLWAASLSAGRPLAGLFGLREGALMPVPSRLTTRINRAASEGVDLEALDLDRPESLWARFVAGPAQLAALAGASRASTDDLPLAEFHGHGTTVTNPGIENLTLLLNAWAPDGEAERITSGDSGASPAPSTDFFLALAPRRAARRELAAINLALADVVQTGWHPSRVLPLLDRLGRASIQAPHDPEIAYEYWDLLLDVAASAFDARRMAAAKQLYAMALDVGPERDFILRQLALTKAMTGQPGDGLDEARQACRIRPENPENWQVLQQVALSAGATAEAARADEQTRKRAHQPFNR